MRRATHTPPPFTPHVLRIAVSSVDPRYISALVQLRDKDGRPHGLPAVMILERARDGIAPVDGPAREFPSPCAPGRPAGVRSLMCPSPWRVLHYPPPRLEAQTSLAQPIQTSDLHLLDWSQVPLPGAVCGSSRPIWREGGYVGALIRPDVDLLWWNRVVVSVATREPVFGGRNEAALTVVCANDGGTADAQLAFSVVVFQAKGHTLRVLGILRPNAPLNPYLGHVPLVGDPKFRGDAISVTETWYGAQDGTCCGSGRATTVWTYRRGSFHPRTTIIRRPWASPITIGDFLAPCGDMCRRVHLTRRLHFRVWLDNYGPLARNVSLTLTLRQGTRTVHETKSVPVVKASGGKLVFGNFHHLKPGAVNVTVDLHRAGAFPLTYRYALTRP
jgi:hypothetical protein